MPVFLVLSVLLLICCILVLVLSTPFCTACTSVPFIHPSPFLNPLSGIADPHLITPEEPNPTGFNNSDRQQIRGEPRWSCMVFTAEKNQSRAPSLFPCAASAVCYLCAPAECQSTERDRGSCKINPVRHGRAVWVSHQMHRLFNFF